MPKPSRRKGQTSPALHAQKDPNAANAHLGVAGAVAAAGDAKDSKSGAADAKGADSPAVVFAVDDVAPAAFSFSLGEGVAAAGSAVGASDAALAAATAALTAPIGDAGAAGAAGAGAAGASKAHAHVETTQQRMRSVMRDTYVEALTAENEKLRSQLTALTARYHALEVEHTALQNKVAAAVGGAAAAPAAAADTKQPALSFSS